MKAKAKTALEKEKDYVEFLRKLLASANYKANVSPEEYAATKARYEKAKFKLRILGGQK